MFAYLTEYCKADHTQAAIQMFRQARLIDPLHVNARGKIEKTNSFACLFFLNVFLVMNVFISDRLLGDCWSFSCCGSYCDWALEDRCLHGSRDLSFSSRWWRQVSLHRIRWLLEVGPGFTAGGHSNRLEGWRFMPRNVLVGLRWRRPFLWCSPTPAVSERVFAAVRRAFDEQQRSSLSDYLTATVMLGYNHRDQKPKKTGVPDSMFDNVVEHD